jgi:POT family proton-dependent oligopeptide transporter
MTQVISNHAPRGGDGVKSPGWLGYPKGAWLVIVVEFWERFSFYGMLAILALFLTDKTEQGGFGWSDDRALIFVGFYTGAMYALPAFGGYLADKVLGRRRAVTIGAGLMLFGQVMLVSPWAIPALLSYWSSLPLLTALQSLGIPLGTLFQPDIVESAIHTYSARFSADDGSTWLMIAYISASLGLYIAIGSLIAGNALMKSTLVVLCGDLFAHGDARRDGAYTYYYLGIDLGGLLSGLVVGFVAKLYGWYSGFFVGAVGMAVAFSLFLTFGTSWLGAVGNAVQKVSHKATAEIEELRGQQHSADRKGLLRLLLIAFLAMFLCAFSTAWFQIYGSWSLFLDRSVDRSIGDFVVPVPWFSSWNAAVIILMAPLTASLWVYLATRGKHVDIIYRYAFALACAAIGHLLMYRSAGIAASGAVASVWGPLVAIALLSIGELVAWTSTYGFVYRVAPIGYASATMGAWYLLTLGLGGYFSGVVGRQVDGLGYAKIFLAIGLSLGLLTLIAILARSTLKNLAAEADVVL